MMYGKPMPKGAKPTTKGAGTSGMAKGGAVKKGMAKGGAVKKGMAKGGAVKKGCK